MKRDWLREPIVVLPLAAALVFFLCLPFVLFGTQGAPQFYGAFFAALTGLAGVLAGALYNAQLTRRRDDRLERMNSLAAARVAKHEFELIRGRLVHIRREFNTAREEADDDDVELTPYLTLMLRRRIGDGLKSTETDKHVLVLCKQSQAIAEPLLGFLQYRASFIETEEAIRTRLDQDAESRKAEFWTWQMLKSDADVMSNYADDLVPALAQFLSVHAGEFA